MWAWLQRINGDTGIRSYLLTYTWPCYMKVICDTQLLWHRCKLYGKSHMCHMLPCNLTHVIIWHTHIRHINFTYETDNKKARHTLILDATLRQQNWRNRYLQKLHLRWLIHGWAHKDGTAAHINSSLKITCLTPARQQCETWYLVHGIASLEDFPQKHLVPIAVTVPDFLKANSNCRDGCRPSWQCA